MQLQRNDLYSIRDVISLFDGLRTVCNIDVFSGGGVTRMPATCEQRLPKKNPH